MSRTEKLLFRAIAVGGIMLAILITILGRQTMDIASGWRTPLGPPLDLPTWTFVPSLTNAPTRVLPSSVPQVTLRPTITLSDSASSIASLTAPPPPGDTQCGGPPVMTILAVGSDTRSNSYLYGLADVIRLVRVDFVTMRVTILEFPRDFWVEIPEVVKKRGYTHGKLNQAYFFGNPGMGYYDGPGQGPGLLARTLDYNFGARADHYLAINMRTFEKVIDAVGGIDLYLPYTVDARKKDQPKRMDLYFEAGYHHLNGQSALMLARIRQYTVFGRASNQNLVLCALRDQFVTPYVFPQIPAIVEAFKGSVQTDLTPEQISQLACLASKKSQMKIVFAEFPQSVMTPTRVYDPSSKLDLFIFDVDNSVIRGYVANFMNGTWPEITADIGTPSASGMNAAVCP